VLVVSPHLDDAVLSIGGTLGRLTAAGIQVTVATLFTAPPAQPVPAGARAFHLLCGLGDDAMRHRMTEDVAACTTLGVHHRHLGLLEALYRLDPDGRPRHADGRAIFRADPAHEPDLMDSVQRHIVDLRDELRPELVLGPLGIGHHIDHLITHCAIRHIGLEPDRVRWFEDLPYAMNRQFQGWAARISSDLRSGVVRIDADRWKLKIAAIGHYSSQLDVLWDDPTPWPTQLRDYAIEIGEGEAVERLWRHR